MTNIIIATKNPTKVNAIKAAFSRYFANVKTSSIKVDAGIPKQPIGDDVFIGAENKLDNLKKKIKSNSYDFLVSCEGGIICLAGKWFNVQVVCIENSNGKRSFGLGQGYPIPEKYINQIMKKSLVDILNELYDGQGGIRILTRGELTGYSVIKAGTVMALTEQINGEIW